MKNTKTQKLEILKGLKIVKCLVWVHITKKVWNSWPKLDWTTYDIIPKCVTDIDIVNSKTLHDGEMIEHLNIMLKRVKCLPLTWARLCSHRLGEVMTFSQVINHHLNFGKNLRSWLDLPWWQHAWVWWYGMRVGHYHNSCW